MLLADLLTYAGISGWDRHFWFGKAELRGDVLLVQDAASASFVTNCWLPQLREHVTGLRVIVADTAESTPKLPQKPKGKPLWNAKGLAHHRRLGGLE